MALSIPGYRIKTELGRGGMARVYLALQESLDRDVALKVMSDTLSHDEEFCHRFIKEGRFVARLNHPNILTVHDIGDSNGHYYLSTEYISGGSVEDYLDQGITPARALQVVRDIAAALGAAHKKHIVHRDIKPSNILLREDGTCVLADFGIAKALDTTNTIATAPGFSIGTPIYMSPEQSRGETLDGRCDIYSLGAVLFELLAGHKPYWSDNPLALALMHIKDPLPDLPPGLEPLQALVHRMLAKDRTQRHADAAEVIAAVDELAPVAQTLAAPTRARRSTGDRTRSVLHVATGNQPTKRLDDAASQVGPATQAVDACMDQTIAADAVASPASAAPAVTQVTPRWLRRGHSHLALGAVIFLGLATVFWPRPQPGLDPATLAPMDASSLLGELRHLQSVAGGSHTGKGDVDAVLSVLERRMIGMMNSGDISRAKAVAQEITTLFPNYESPATKTALQAIVGNSPGDGDATRSPTRVVKPATDSTEDIPGLLGIGRTYLLRGSLTSPSGANAWEAFQRVLEIEPDNAAAIAGRKAVLDNYLSAARTFRRQGRIPLALEAVQTGLEVAPDHAELRKLRDELEQALLHPKSGEPRPDGSQ